jgi:predicted RNA binding protein YcfA (HicA-like mRNA interferase family)
MPPKVRELIGRLKAAGFRDQGGKGSHRNFLHATGVRVTVSGAAGDDAKPYQEKEIQLALRKVAE